MSENNVHTVIKKDRAHFNTEIITLKQCCGSVTFPDPVADQDPRIRTSVWRIRISNKNSYRNYKTVEIMVFLTIFAWWWKDPDPDLYLWLTDPDADPGGPKTYGSGSTTLLWRLSVLYVMWWDYSHNTQLFSLWCKVCEWVFPARMHTWRGNIYRNETRTAFVNISCTFVQLFVYGVHKLQGIKENGLC